MNAPDNVRGIVMMLIAMGFLSCMDAGLKQLSASYPPLQVTALRSLASLPLIAAWAFWAVGARALLQVRWRLHLLRGAVVVATLTLFVYGIRDIPLSTTYTLFFIAPLVIALLSGVVLKERIGRHRWLAIGAGLGGVLIAMRPTGEGALSWAGLAILAAAIGYAVAAVMVRVMGRNDSTASIVFWTLAIMAPVSTLLALPGWVRVEPGHLWLIGAVGLVGALGQYAITEAFARGEASVVAPFEYTTLAWGLGFDLAIWGVLPGAWTWAGATVIVASGVYLMRRERSVRLEAQVQP